MDVITKPDDVINDAGVPPVFLAIYPKLLVEVPILSSALVA